MPVTPTFPNPVDLPPVIKLDTEKVWIEVFKEMDGTPIMDAAGQLPLKPQFDLMSICVYRITKNVADYTDINWRDQNNTLNSDTWRSAWLEGEAWCEVIPHLKYDSNTNAYYELHYTVRCLRGGWKKLLPEAGYAYLDGTDVKDCKTDDGTVQIRKLAADGSLLDNSLPMVLTEKDTKRLVSFSFIG